MAGGRRLGHDSMHRVGISRARAGAMMANDTDWVADVRRWVRAAAQTKPADVAPLTADNSSELGYEAAQPSLQAGDWVAAPRTDFTHLR
jgi:hypothetical protein